MYISCNIISSFLLGFNQVDTTYTKAQEKHMIRKQRQLDEHKLKNRGKSVSKLSPKTHRKGN